MEPPLLFDHSALTRRRAAVLESALQVHIFRAEGRVFGLTQDAGGTNLPAGLGAWTAFKSLELNRGTPQAGVNVDECLDDIEKYGFHLTDAHVRITGRYV